MSYIKSDGALWHTSKRHVTLGRWFSPDCQPGASMTARYIRQDPPNDLITCRRCLEVVKLREKKALEQWGRVGA